MGSACSCAFRISFSKNVQSSRTLLLLRIQSEELCQSPSQTGQGLSLFQRAKGLQFSLKSSTQHLTKSSHWYLFVSYRTCLGFMWEKKNSVARVEKTLINKAADCPIKNTYVGGIYDVNNIHWKKPHTNTSESNYASLKRINVLVLISCNIKDPFECMMYVYCEISWV